MQYDPDYRQYTNPWWIIREHLHNGRFIKDLAKECDVSPRTMSYWIVKLGLTKKKKKTKMFYRSKSWLNEEYILKRKSTKQIAREIDCHYTTIIRWLAIHKIRKMRYN